MPTYNELCQLALLGRKMQVKCSQDIYTGILTGVSLHDITLMYGIQEIVIRRELITQITMLRSGNEYTDDTDLHKIRQRADDFRLQVYAHPLDRSQLNKAFSDDESELTRITECLDQRDYNSAMRPVLQYISQAGGLTDDFIRRWAAKLAVLCGNVANLTQGGHTISKNGRSVSLKPMPGVFMWLDALAGADFQQLYDNCILFENYIAMCVMFEQYDHLAAGLAVLPDQQQYKVLYDIFALQEDINSARMCLPGAAYGPRRLTVRLQSMSTEHSYAQRYAGITRRIIAEGQLCREDIAYVYEFKKTGENRSVQAVNGCLVNILIKEKGQQWLPGQLSRYAKAYKKTLDFEAIPMALQENGQWVTMEGGPADGWH